MAFNIRICQICDEPFSAKSNNAKYCTPECNSVAVNIRAKAYYHSKKATKSFERSCYFCGGTFISEQWKKYCPPLPDQLVSKCKKAVQSQARIKKRKKDKEKGPYPEDAEYSKRKRSYDKICEICGKLFVAGSNTAKYCPKPCRLEAYKAKANKRRKKVMYKDYQKKWRSKNSKKRNEKARLIRQTPLGRARALYGWAKARAKKENAKFNLSLTQILKSINEGKCEITGFEFDLLPSKKFKHRNPWAPSVDRIKPKDSYEDDNVQIVCWQYNVAKHAWKLEEFKLLLQGALSKKKLNQVCEAEKLLRKRAASLLARTKARAKKKQIAYDENLEDLIVKKIMGGFCEKTNIAFKIKDSFGRHNSPWSPSIDRIDNNKGYVANNIQIVCWSYNLAKGQLSQGDFDKFLYATAKGHGII